MSLEKKYKQFHLKIFKKLLHIISTLNKNNAIIKQKWIPLPRATLRERILLRKPFNRI